ncbi:hypothetical protein [Schinkia azotoformans]|uniref:hypothetical protein n=1 Tax=Schinkia azotoformans TaxID=1454 RepID=UPI002DBDAE9C|nr:hypothetical protein [Schinkia azotoformans]MEC1719071.1 hypothetical protein [Schinkia azotoformans]MED4413881.1 hypothetical protein [Schinkia azotoformans]
MSLLTDLMDMLGPIDIPIETGGFSGKPPDEYIVITPMSDRLDFYADNQAHNVIEEARLSLFSKKNYIERKKQLTKALLAGGMTITDRQYIGFENDTKYHHYAIDVLKEYEVEDE